jgi:hypothetical protein
MGGSRRLFFPLVRSASTLRRGASMRLMTLAGSRGLVSMMCAAKPSMSFGIARPE